MSERPILPGATVGCLGGGQLGRMFALAARRMGYRVHTVDPMPDSPTGQISDREYNSSFDDIPTLLEFAAGVDVVTYEFENIPVTALDALAPRVKLRPGRNVLYVCQNRRREKEFLQGNGFPVVPFAVVNSEAELRKAVATLGCPCVLKTADFGYDGKGQQKIAYETDLAEVWRRHGDRAGIVEAWVPFTAELSVVVARGVLKDEDENPGLSADGQRAREPYPGHLGRARAAGGEHRGPRAIDRVRDRNQARRHRSARGGIFPDQTRRSARK
jgi:5-(carboxyamino)imidazole ribonucleotide synthase